MVRPPGRPMYRASNCPLFLMCAYASAREQVKLIINVESVDYIADTTLIFFVRVTLFAGSFQIRVVVITAANLSCDGAEANLLLCQNFCLNTSLMSPIQHRSLLLSISPTLCEIRRVSPDISTKYPCNCTKSETVIQPVRIFESSLYFYSCFSRFHLVLLSPVYAHCTQ